MLDKDGKKLEVTLSTHSEDPNRVQTIEFMQAIFRAGRRGGGGQITDWPSFSTNYVQKSQHQIALLGWLNIVDPDGCCTRSSRRAAPPTGAAIPTPRSTRRCRRAARRSIRRRAAAYRKAATILAEELPYYIISDQGYQLFYSKEAAGDGAGDAARKSARADRLRERIERADGMLRRLRHTPAPAV